MLQERVLEHVGKHCGTARNVRIIAAANRNLSLMAGDGTFRREMLYRLSIFPVYIPAMRERPEDVPVLLNFFILQQSRRMGFSAPPELSPSESSRLMAYPGREAEEHSPAGQPYVGKRKGVISSSLITP